jgi:putative ABC transport system substrate-binding protein
MNRRELMRLAGAAAVLPRAARAQQSGRVRRIGVLQSLAETDVEAQAWDTAFRKRLDELGWIDGRAVRIDYRWGAGNVERMQLFAKELVRLEPDVLLSVSTPATAALQQQTRMIPIVFAVVSDPVGSGFVASLAKPGGNITGFIDIEGSLSGKWLQLLREVAPRVSRVAFMFNPQTAPFARYYLDTFLSSASAMGIEPVEAAVRGVYDVEEIMTVLGRDAGAGVIIMPDTAMLVHRDLIHALAARDRMPVIYPYRFFVLGGGLMSYGVVVADLLRQAATYIDRILRGAKPADLPVQLPIKFELILNLMTARALGLDVPPTLIARADEVIE